MSKLIKVAVLVLPDGTTEWMEQSVDRAELEKRLKDFKDKHSKKYLESGVTSGVVFITMTENDYYSIPTVNDEMCGM